MCSHKGPLRQQFDGNLIVTLMKPLLWVSKSIPWCYTNDSYYWRLFIFFGYDNERSCASECSNIEQNRNLKSEVNTILLYKWSITGCCFYFPSLWQVSLLHKWNIYERICVGFLRTNIGITILLYNSNL